MSDAFAAALDADPSDSAARLLYADWLEERGDERAAGYRWMAERGKWPYETISRVGWRWYEDDLQSGDPAAVGEELFDATPEPKDRRGYAYSSRRAAEDALAWAFAGREAVPA